MVTMAAILNFQREQFNLFLIYKSTRCFLPSFKSTGLLVQEKKQKIDFQDGRHSGHLGFPIGTILAIFDLQVTLMFPTKFQVNWPRGRSRRLLKQIVDAAWRTTDTDQSQYALHAQVT